MKVLIADDDRIFSHMIASQLRAKGWSVEVALDTMQTVMYAMRTAPDVITLDINMPGGSGLGALKKLKTSTKTSQIPVVVVSGSIDPAAETSVLALGAAAYVPKPCEPDALAATLARVTGTASERP